MDKVKIQEIANEVGVSNAELIEKAKELGYVVKAANSTVTVDQAGTLLDYLLNGIRPKLIKRETIEKIQIYISNLKTIKTFEWEFELKKGLMAVIGTNGIGKSSFIISLAKLIHPNVFRDELVGSGYKDTIIKYFFNDTDKYIWSKPHNWREEHTRRMPNIVGYFESSILGGKRFRIYNNLKYIEVEHEDKIEEASEFIRSNMNYIMYGNNGKEERFKTLCKVLGVRRKRRELDRRYKDMSYEWYALKVNEHYVHEYFFSTGEYFLLSLLKFIENLVVKKRNNNVAMIVIDEIELSLHTLAQRRLVEKLEEFSNEYNIMIIFTTHSLQIIEVMNPNNIFLFENKDGVCSISSPCYPGYLTSRLESHKYYDRIILVEDELAEMFIIEILREQNLHDVLYKIIPIGGWEKVLEIYLLNERKKFYSDAKVLVVLDGDMIKEKKVNSGSKKNINKRFLPLENVEKYVVTLILNEDEKFIKYIETFISPTLFKNLDFFLKDDVLSKTDFIKDGFYHFLEAIIKEARYMSRDELKKRIIEYILKSNKDDEKYSEFANNIVKFLHED